ncbi:metal ABC transporter substrate-binding protein [Nocardioides flavescens]|uniref:Zinc ABC transporter solute-binding protein n=1 Tax=Nocardioides flavescens TaxID=2691959 RepID=A0A6L7EY53_9ACTN|nr:metal ABC transporter substrate-binding protein [Nocardioides flavescens]MXG90866.1 zinc ABC transporter solute-binding protein [Nocardioides flavescens]
MRRSTVPALLLALPLTLAASGCAAFSDDPRNGSDAGSGDGPVSVAAAFYPLAFIAERVGGDDVTVTNLTSPGAEPHDLELSVKETADIEGADLVLIEHGLQPAVDDAASQLGGDRVLDATDVVDLLPASADVVAEEHAEEEGHSDEHSEDAHSEGDGHDHGDLDPHFWQDPTRMATLTTAVADRLAEIDPDHADTYRANGEALVSDLQALDTAYTQGLANCQRDTIVVSHDAFSYLGRYGLTVEGIAGLSPDAEPTPADLQRLQELITSDGITTVFSERLVSPRLAQSLADDLGITTAVLDPIEGLSSDTSDEDYLSLMQENLAALEQANGCS